MKLIEFPTYTPEEQIALDELLLHKAEAGELGETLRFWTARDYFVVVGRAGKVQEDCFPKRCRHDGIKILRRISGGGTVLQGPGCFNYSAVLAYKGNKEYENIRTSFRHILRRISGTFKARGLNVEFFPISDLALDGRKISGNAQARKKKYFLLHGTFLYDFDLDRISYYLTQPAEEPDYRKGRSHKDFLANIPVSEEELKKAVKDVFFCSGNAWEPEDKDLNGLAVGKYADDSWNYS